WDSREIITLVFSSDAARNVPTLTAHRSLPKNLILMFLCQNLKICGHLSHLCHQRAIENSLQNRIFV
ncbi:MAG: hypothetical protein IKU94_01145, partial [Bacteroidaceae bacterium]|nr:hypothetical protein [Bacteroidaceae bacterium]